jgi:signal transduction histidine kinase
MPVPTNHIITQVIIITLIFLLVAAFLILYVLLYNKRKKKHNEEKERLRIEFEKELIKTQMEVQEQTLQTIASDIHDNIGQLLSLARLTLSTVDIPGHPIKAQEKVSTSLDLLTTSVKELRQLASVLHAENILSSGLESALESEITWISRSDKYKVFYNVIGKNEKKIDSKKEVIAFRLIQELFNNIIKHANASEIKIELLHHLDSIRLKIHDDGVGFNVEDKISNPTGLGVKNLYKRAGLIGGELIIESGKGNGTLAILTIPYIS